MEVRGMAWCVVRFLGPHPQGDAAREFEHGAHDLMTED